MQHPQINSSSPFLLRQLSLGPSSLNHTGRSSAGSPSPSLPSSALPADTTPNEPLRPSQTPAATLPQFVHSPDPKSPISPSPYGLFALPSPLPPPPPRTGSERRRDWENFLRWTCLSALTIGVALFVGFDFARLFVSSSGSGGSAPSAATVSFDAGAVPLQTVALPSLLWCGSRVDAGVQCLTRVKSPNSSVKEWIGHNCTGTLRPIDPSQLQNVNSPPSAIKCFLWDFGPSPPGFEAGVLEELQLLISSSTESLNVIKSESISVALSSDNNSTLFQSLFTSFETPSSATLIFNPPASPSAQYGMASQAVISNSGWSQRPNLWPLSLNASISTPAAAVSAPATNPSSIVNPLFTAGQPVGDGIQYSGFDFTGTLGGVLFLAYLIYCCLFGALRVNPFGIVQRYVTRTAPGSFSHAREVPPDLEWLMGITRAYDNASVARGDMPRFRRTSSIMDVAATYAELQAAGIAPDSEEASGVPLQTETTVMRHCVEETVRRIMNKRDREIRASLANWLVGWGPRKLDEFDGV
ncbi:hypothetical protein BDK51DRAFT_42605 [Blyttiomyces helicus]|uniref:Uncharacterized protein n=1 Tax=Blyttiomyces helicus TaxID=388810 RepID=A0A4P9WG51_9FUNG|nr:hypothetical protein BDK51DRAFT_42605 [Blyttiomyces helicus]|eukprot:RKO90875.1 hypothetical protein BDK51DRAFT_42605 [Blyttiomyces helicus]